MNLKRVNEGLGVKHRKTTTRWFESQTKHTRPTFYYVEKKKKKTRLKREGTFVRFLLSNKAELDWKKQSYYKRIKKKRIILSKNNHGWSENENTVK